MKMVDMIMECGFNLYESKILEVLSKNDYMSVKNISLNSNVPMNKVYEIINEFLDKGYVEVFYSKPKLYKIAGFKEILNDKLFKRQEELKKLQRKIRSIEIDKTEFKNVNFSIMQGQNAMINKVVEILDMINEESIGFIDVLTAKHENLQAAQKAIARGVKIYFLIKPGDEHSEMIKRYIRIGVDVRVYDISDAGYSIFDKKYVQLRISKDKILTLWIEDENFAAILREHFFSLWQKSRPVRIKKSYNRG